jgi:hypothetical protein
VQQDSFIHRWFFIFGWGGVRGVFLALGFHRGKTVPGGGSGSRSPPSSKDVAEVFAAAESRSDG